MSYRDFLKTKQKEFISSGFEVDKDDMHSELADFQLHGVTTALRKGRFALFHDCGLGKTFQMLEWAKHVNFRTCKPVLILAPLAVVDQTLNEASKWGYVLEKYNNGSNNQIINYDQLQNVDVSIFSGVILDESSILKGRDRKMSNMLLHTFKDFSYKLCCTATPSPNDHMELGQHSEFLGAMSYLEMLSMFFVHDGGETSKWRLRKHAIDDFWKYVCTWSMSIDNPSTLGFNSDGYCLPKINYIEHIIELPNNSSNLFGDVAVSATELHKDLKRSFVDRLEKAKELVNSNNEQWLVWTLKNDEAKELNKHLNDSVNVQGSDKAETKANNLNGFSNGDFKTLITKASIASFGMNFQQCHNMIFTSYDFKFEAFYQAVRRCYRFGQKEEVNVHILIPSSQKNVRKSIIEKEKKHIQKIKEMAKYSSDADYKSNTSKVTINQKDIKNDRFWLMNGDCVEMAKKIPENEIDLVVFSPPFAELYVYSDKAEDMGNVSNYNQFRDHFEYLIPEIQRTLKKGRICAIHCMDLPIQKGKEGFIGLRDFSGMIIDMFLKYGFIYHARTTIWKNPVTEMQRTKALGLLHKQIKKDSSMSRVGIPDYVLFFRNGDGNDTPITHQDSDPSKPDYLPVDLWQKYASPVWHDITYNRTLQYRSGRDGNDEKHICPLQLDTIERIIHLYSNEGETVGSFFGGIGSEGYQALKMNRNSVSIELKESYFKLNVSNHENALVENRQLKLF